MVGIVKDVTAQVMVVLVTVVVLVVALLALVWMLVD